MALFIMITRTAPSSHQQGSVSWSWSLHLARIPKKTYQFECHGMNSKHASSVCQLQLRENLVLNPQDAPKKRDIPSATASSATTSLGGFFSKKDWPGTFSPEFPHKFSRFSICSPGFLPFHYQSPSFSRFSPDFLQIFHGFRFHRNSHVYPTWPRSHCGVPTFHFQCGHRHRAAQPSSMSFL